MEDGWWAQRPFIVALTLLWLIAMARGQATYWLARGVAGTTIRRTMDSNGWRRSVHDWLAGEGVGSGRRAIERRGLPMISLAYLTVGFQTLVMAGAGVMRIQWSRFTLAQVPGVLDHCIEHRSMTQTLKHFLSGGGQPRLRPRPRPRPTTQ